MRDLNNNGNFTIGGDLNINESPPGIGGACPYRGFEYIPEMTTEELLDELQGRQNAIEYDKKSSKSFNWWLARRIFLVSIASLAFTSIWAWFAGEPELISLLIGLATILIGLLSLNIPHYPNKDDVAVITEIERVLKLRETQANKQMQPTQKTRG